MNDRCDSDIFKNGRSVVTLDACRHRAERFAQAVAKASGQRVDWHYSGGLANVLYIGDYDKVAAAVRKCAPLLSEPLKRRAGECGSCEGCDHRPGQIYGWYPPNAHGPYREGDNLPDGTIGVITTR